MQRKRVAWRIVSRERRIAGDEFGHANKIEARRGQRRHVQRLANVACGVVGTIRVVVQERAARGKVQHRGKSQQRQCAGNARSSEDAST